MLFFLNRILKPLLDLIGRWEALHTIESFLWPTLLAASAALTGYVGHEPWMWIIVATTLTFASTTIGILAYAADKMWTDPVNKLQIQAIFQTDLTPAELNVGNRHQRRAASAEQTVRQLSSTELNADTPRTIDRGQLGVEVFNSARFPISVVFSNARTEIETLKPGRTEYPKAPIEIAPGARIRFCDDVIPMNQFPCGKLSGKIDIILRYGRKGKEIHELLQKGQVSINMENWGWVVSVSLDPSIGVT